MLTRFRVYGKKVRDLGVLPNKEDYNDIRDYWRAMDEVLAEYKYIDHIIYDDGTERCEFGTEDMSHKRAKGFKWYYIMQWTGDHNKGGHKVWEEIASYKVLDTQPKELLMLHPGWTKAVKR